MNIEQPIVALLVVPIVRALWIIQGLGLLYADILVACTE